MKTNYQKIAVAIDFSDESLKSLNRAVKIAHDNEATLQIINVIDTKSFGSVSAYDLKYADKLKVEHEEKMKELLEQVQQAGVSNVETIVVKGNPKVILTDLTGIDLIVCGSTGLNQAEKFMLGSVSERIVRHAKCDVLVVRL